MTLVKPADTFRMSRDGQTVMVDLGCYDRANPGGRTVDVTDRVFLSLETARHLVVWLGEALAPHKERMLAEEAKSLPPAAAAIAARPGAVAERADSGQAGEVAAQLMRMVASWEVPYVHERSARFSAEGLHANRFLLTLNTLAIPGNPAGRIAMACDRLGMPMTMRETALTRIGGTRCVHFGFEGASDSIVCKLYLEREVPAPVAEAARKANHPVELYVAFKWDLLRDAAVTTRYLWFPGLSAEEIQARLAHVYRDGHTASLDLAMSLLRQAAERTEVRDLHYMEVEEDQNGRRSFDLNIYNANLYVRDIAPALRVMRARFAIRPSVFQALYDEIRNMRFGHIAGGIHRNGEDFFNIYYGAAQVPVRRDGTV